MPKKLAHEAEPQVEIKRDGGDLVIIRNGVKIAKRGKPRWPTATSTSTLMRSPHAVPITTSRANLPARFSIASASAGAPTNSRGSSMQSGSGQNSKDDGWMVGNGFHFPQQPKDLPLMESLPHHGFSKRPPNR